MNRRREELCCSSTPHSSPFGVMTETTVDKKLEASTRCMEFGRPVLLLPTDCTFNGPFPMPFFRFLTKYYRRGRSASVLPRHSRRFLFLFFFSLWFCGYIFLLRFRLLRLIISWLDQSAPQEILTGNLSCGFNESGLEVLRRWALCRDLEKTLDWWCPRLGKKKKMQGTIGLGLFSRCARLVRFLIVDL